MVILGRQMASGVERRTGKIRLGNWRQRITVRGSNEVGIAPQADSITAFLSIRGHSLPTRKCFPCSCFPACVTDGEDLFQRTALVKQLSAAPIELFTDGGS